MDSTRNDTRHDQRHRSEEFEQIGGTIRAVDLDRATFDLRFGDDIRQVCCAFDDYLSNIVKVALDRRVYVTGSRMEPGRRSPAALRVIRLEILDDEAAEPSSDVETD